MSREDPDRRVPGEDPEGTPEDDSPYPWMRLEEAESAPPFRPWMIVVAGLSVAIFVVAVWYAWNEGQSVSDGPPPVVEAEDTPVKTPPEEPGGMDVPHQEKTVFNTIEDDGGKKAESEEELLPPPEEPVDRPGEEKTANAGSDQAAASVEKQSTDTAPDNTAADGGEMAAAESDAGGDAEPETAPDQETESEPADATDQEETSEPAPRETAQAESAPAEDTQTETAATGGYAVQLAAVASREAAESAWARFVKAHPRLLGPLTRDIQPVEVSGRTLYRVLAAGIADRAEAEALCQDLTDQGQSCLVKER